MFLLDFITIGGKFQSSLVNHTTIKVDSLQSMLPGQSAKIKVTFLGNILNLKAVDKFAPSSSSSQPKFLGVLLIFFSLIALYFIYIILNIFIKNSNNGGCSTWGGCHGGCGCGCGGGFGGGG